VLSPKLEGSKPLPGRRTLGSMYKHSWSRSLGRPAEWACRVCFVIVSPDGATQPQEARERRTNVSIGETTDAQPPVRGIEDRRQS
jgi:hypothetical protein